MNYPKVVLIVESFIRKFDSNASAATDGQIMVQIHHSLLGLKCINHGLMQTDT